MIIGSLQLIRIVYLFQTVGCNNETAKKQASKRCKDLATFMETFMDEINKPPDTKVDVHMEDDKSFSVMHINDKQDGAKV